MAAVTGEMPHGKSQRLKDAWQLVAACLPPLTGKGPESVKGGTGRIGVLGGSRVSTGAPYFAAISALKAGSDLAYVFTEESACAAIKAYYPEIYVIPCIPSKPLGAPPEEDSDAILNAAMAMQQTIFNEVEKCDALVVGNGLSSDPATLEAVGQIIVQVRKRNIPIVIDGEAIALVTKQPDMIANYPKVVLTPNAQEFSNLCKALTVPDDLQALCWNLGKVTVLVKGKADRASDGTVVLTADEPGSARRGAGQGDVCAGLLASFMFWAHQKGAEGDAFSPNLVAAAAASTITRRSAALAFQSRGRSMTTSDLVDNIHAALEEFFPTEGLALSPIKSPKREE